MLFAYPDHGDANVVGRSCLPTRAQMKNKRAVSGKNTWTDLFSVWAERIRCVNLISSSTLKSAHDYSQTILNSLADIFYRASRISGDIRLDDCQSNITHHARGPHIKRHCRCWTQNPGDSAIQAKTNLYRTYSCFSTLTHRKLRVQLNVVLYDFPMYNCLFNTLRAAACMIEIGNYHISRLRLLCFMDDWARCTISANICHAKQLLGIRLKMTEFNDERVLWIIYVHTIWIVCFGKDWAWLFYIKPGNPFLRCV